MSRVVFGDCVRVLRKEENEFDLCLTDPPYNIGFDGLPDNENNIGGRDEGMGFPDTMPEQDYRDWCAGWWREVKRVARRAVFSCGRQNLAWWLGHDEFEVVVWHNTNGRGESKVARFRHWEPLLCYNVNRRGGASKFEHDIFSCPSEMQIFSTRTWLTHPTPKPLKLWGWILDQLKPASVVDPFLGSGTTAYACEQRGIPYLGIEIDTRYKDQILRSAAVGRRKKQKGLF